MKPFIHGMPDLSGRAAKRLREMGCETFEDVRRAIREKSEAEFLREPGLGPKTLREIRVAAGLPPRHPHDTPELARAEASALASQGRWFAADMLRRYAKLLEDHGR